MGLKHNSKGTEWTQPATRFAFLPTKVLPKNCYGGKMYWIWLKPYTEILGFPTPYTGWVFIEKYGI